MKKKVAVPHQLRQGDVLLVAASYRGEKEGKPIPKEAGRTVLMHGEVTGHAHAIQPGAKVAYFDADAERFLTVMEKVGLGHEEHTAVFLAPNDAAAGKYQQAFQVEEHGEEVRRVVD